MIKFEFREFIFMDFHLKDVDVLGQILNAYDSSQSPSLEKLARMALRTFYINLAIVIRSARISSPNAATIDRLIRGMCSFRS